MRVDAILPLQAGHFSTALPARADAHQKHEPHSKKRICLAITILSGFIVNRNGSQLYNYWDYYSYASSFLRIAFAGLKICFHICEVSLPVFVFCLLGW
jgi:hypothetical protein